MQETNIKLYNYGYAEVKTYSTAFLFALGNIILPQLFHLVPHGGMTWLPIYFFTLIGAYKYGWKVGLLTALCSPTINSILFGMPMSAVLPAITIKSVLLAIGAGYIAHKFNQVSIPLLTAAVLFYQLLGTIAEWGMTGNIYTALQDFRIGVPGMLLQIIGGYTLIKYIIRK